MFKNAPKPTPYKSLFSHAFRRSRGRIGSERNALTSQKPRDQGRQRGRPGGDARAIGGVLGLSYSWEAARALGPPVHEARTRPGSMGTVAAPSEYASLTDDARESSTPPSNEKPRTPPPPPQPSPRDDGGSRSTVHVAFRLRTTASELKAAITLWPLFGSEAPRLNMGIVFGNIPEK